MIKTVVLLTLSVFCICQSANAVEPKLTTKVINWTRNPKYMRPSDYHPGTVCGKVTMDLPKNMYTNSSAIHIKLDHERWNPTVEAFGEGLSFLVTCKVKDFELGEGDITYNEKLQKWVWKGDGSSDDIYQIKAKNGFGWLFEDEADTNIRSVRGSTKEAYTRDVAFCITSNDRTKQMCGSGLIQYIPYKKDLYKNIGDYTKTVYKILQTVKFEDAPYHYEEEGPF